MGAGWKLTLTLREEDVERLCDLRGVPMTDANLTAVRDLLTSRLGTPDRDGVEWEELLSGVAEAAGVMPGDDGGRIDWSGGYSLSGPELLDACMTPMQDIFGDGDRSWRGPAVTMDDGRPYRAQVILQEGMPEPYYAQVLLGADGGREWWFAGEGKTFGTARETMAYLEAKGLVDGRGSLEERLGPANEPEARTGMEEEQERVACERHAQEEQEHQDRKRAAALAL